jgi:hypothetical protein
MIKARKGDGQTLNLIAACATDVILSKVQFSLKMLDENSIARQFSEMETAEIRYSGAGSRRVRSTEPQQPRQIFLTLASSRLFSAASNEIRPSHQSQGSMYARLDVPNHLLVLAELIA